MMTSHWNASGVADGWMPKGLAAFLLPAFSAAVLALLYLLPGADPMHKDVRGFEEPYDRFAFVLVSFMAYLNAVSTYINLGNGLNMSLALTPAFAGLFYFTGALVERAKPNWFVGIRTPWTMSDERVWAKTHAVGAKLFKAGGIAVLSGLFFPALALPLVLAFAVGGGLGTVAYSYIEYGRLQGAADKLHPGKKETKK